MSVQHPKFSSPEQGQILKFGEICLQKHFLSVALVLDMWSGSK